MQNLLRIFFLYIAFLSGKAEAQPESKTKVNRLALGAEAQWYPAGWLAGPAAMYFLGKRDVLVGKLSVNFANRHGWSGLNDDEKGTGIGVSVGYRYLLKEKPNTFFIGVRSELYTIKINWKNNIGLPAETSGSTRTIVFQPSIEAGYLIRPVSKNWVYTFSGGAGREINVVTKGRPVGQGGIWLLQASAFYVF